MLLPPESFRDQLRDGTPRQAGVNEWFDRRKSENGMRSLNGITENGHANS
jgi:hypothetical protein